MKNQVQLITYVDRLGGAGLPALNALLGGALNGLFGGVHLLPFFDPIDGADAGFDPSDHTKVDPKLGDWSDVKKLGTQVEVMADLIVNHVSADSRQFQDFIAKGDQSPFAEMFLTRDRVFPGGASQAELAQVYRPRPGSPFSPVTLMTGETKQLWTTFTPKQIDIDVSHPAGKAYLDSILEKFHAADIKLIRLDAAGYAIKKRGTSCFMIPETFAFIGELTAKARDLGMEVLVEIHGYYQQQIEIAKRVDWVYDFALPPLVLHTLHQGNAKHLKTWLATAPRNSITVLDTHDGIGVIDVGASSSGQPGLLPPADLDQLVETIHDKSGGQSRQATGAAASNLDLYQVNCTYYDALGRDDFDYLVARAIQFFAPGVPQVYYVGLLAGENDLVLLGKTKTGRDINRHYYNRDEVESGAKKPVVAALFELIKFRNSHEAFNGEFRVIDAPDTVLALRWVTEQAEAELRVNLSTRAAVILSRHGDAHQAMDLRIMVGGEAPSET